MRLKSFHQCRDYDETQVQWHYVKFCTYTFTLLECGAMQLFWDQYRQE